MHNVNGFMRFVIYCNIVSFFAIDLTCSLYYDRSRKWRYGIAIFLCLICRGLFKAHLLIEIITNNAPSLSPSAFKSYKFPIELWWKTLKLLPSKELRFFRLASSLFYAVSENQFYKSFRNTLFWKSAEAGDLYTLVKLYNLYQDSNRIQLEMIAFCDYSAFLSAAEEGHIDIIHQLYDWLSKKQQLEMISSYDYYALRWAKNRDILRQIYKWGDMESRRRMKKIKLNDYDFMEEIDSEEKVELDNLRVEFKKLRKEVEESEKVIAILVDKFNDERRDWELERNKMESEIKELRMRNEKNQKI